MNFLNQFLLQFKDCFSRQASFNWFVITIIGTMIRTDKLGLTSIIRDLDLEEKHYTNLLHFFHSDAWDLEILTSKWIELVGESAFIIRENGAAILISDGVKAAHEARKMPGVKKLHQESENSSKPEYIHGHMFGGVGILVGNPTKQFCVPLSLTIQDGVQPMAEWTGEEIRLTSHVVQVIQQAHNSSRIIGKSILLLDRYFLSVPALEKLNELNILHQTDLHIVTKAKRSCVAYEAPPAKKPGRGRPCKKGQRVKLTELFKSKCDEFETKTVYLYGEEQEVKIYSIDLLWGQKLYQELRFVLVEYKGLQSIMVSTDLTLSPEAIIKLYGYRFKIECTFRELKQVVGGFSYQFWSKSLEKLNRYKKKEDPQPLEKITDEEDKNNIIKTIRAIEMYTLCSSIALGLLQLLSLEYGDKLDIKKIRYLRTQSSSYASEATMMSFMRNQIYLMFGKTPDFDIMRIIKSKQKGIISEEIGSSSEVA